ncbi:CFI-box-CTERM domain-containing protein [Thermoproteota archaeon]
MNKIKVTLLLLLIIISSVSIVKAESEPVVPFHPRISSAIYWLLSQEVVYDQEQTGYAASLFDTGEDYYRLYTDDNARLARVLTVSLQYFINEYREHPFEWDDKIKVAINFVKDAQTPTKDFSHYWQLSNPDDAPVGWQRSGEFYFWNAAVLEGLTISSFKMRWDPFIGVPSSDFAYYDGVMNSVKECLDKWQSSSQQFDGAWEFVYVKDDDNPTRDTQISENGQILAALVTLSKYEQNLGNQEAAAKYANWAQKTAQWLIKRQERRLDRDWPEGGGYGGLYNNRDDIVQFSGANGRAIFGLAMYGLNIESIVDNPNPDRAHIEDVMRAWTDGFIARTHDVTWGPYDRVTSTGVHEYPKYTYVAATLGTGTLGAFNFILDNKYYDWATNFYKWMTGNNEKFYDFQNAWTRSYGPSNTGFYLGINNDPPNNPVNKDSNLETNLEALQLMITLNDSSLNWKLHGTSPSSPAQTPPLPSGCIIATATYGSSIAPEVKFMRNVRDNMIGSTDIGKMLVVGWNTFYYSWSSPVATWISNSENLQIMFRTLLLPLVSIIHSTAFIYSVVTPLSLTAASILAFVFAAVASMIIYIVAPLTVLSIIFKRSRF